MFSRFLSPFVLLLLYVVQNARVFSFSPAYAGCTAPPLEAVAVALASMETTSAADTPDGGVVVVEARAGSSAPHLASHPGRFERARFTVLYCIVGWWAKQEAEVRTNLMFATSVCQ